MARDTATSPTADPTDIIAQVAELRTAVDGLITDRETLQAESDEKDARITALENAATASGGVPAAPIERELGKVRRSLVYLRDNAVPRMPLDEAEALVPPDAPVADKVDGGNGISTGTVG